VFYFITVCLGKKYYVGNRHACFVVGGKNFCSFFHEAQKFLRATFGIFSLFYKLSMKTKIILLFLALTFYCSPTLFAEAVNAKVTVCFTPQKNCTKEIVNAINQAQQSILVQAYSFTSRPIVQALARAHDKKVAVKIIVDKSTTKYRYGPLKIFRQHQMPLWVDYLPSLHRGIAHNKIMIIDNKIIITGSFNFTAAAQKRNVENVLIIESPELAQQYTNNWQSRVVVAKKL
jgi:phosphatidylserine/phosphatidylglycerophosphate/cardiolipin synthase-like enzyme